MEKILLTKSGFKKLSAELNYLKITKRKEIAERIEEAKEYGDISESSEYEDAKNEQALVESRIMELEMMIKKSNLIKGNQSKNRVGIGSKIKTQINKSVKNFTIVGAAESAPEKGLISCNSPIARAFLGLKKGDEAEVETPSGIVKYKVLEIR